MKYFRKYQRLFLVLFISSIALLGCSGAADLTNQITSHDNRTSEDVFNNQEEEASSLSVHFLDVGQGNAILAESGGHYMLIDGGDREYSSFVVSYLKKQGVKELDYVIPSHYDADHLNGIVGVLNTIDVKKILSPDYETDTNIYKSYLSAIKKNGYQEHHPALGETFALGTASFTIVAPINYDYSDSNNNSIGIKLTFGSNSFLILGDAEAESEQDMLGTREDLSADVYLASHHGSDSSSSTPLLKAIDPAYGVISVGENSYGHPAKKTLHRLKDRNIKLFRTDIQGTIIAVSDGKTITWNTQPTKDWSSGSNKFSKTKKKRNSDIHNETKKKYDSELKRNKKDSSDIDSKNKSSEKNRLEKPAYYIGNGKTHKFHLPSCSGLPDEKNQVIYHNRQEFIKKGYDPCKICNP